MIEQLKNILNENNNKRICILGTSCTGKTTLIEQTGIGKDMDEEIFPLLTQEEMNKYDAIYVCGGNTEYLVDRMNEINIKQQIQEYLKKGGIYVGVSAGTIAAQALNLIKNEIDVHCENESENKEVTTEPIYLTDDQALLIKDNEKYIFE